MKDIATKKKVPQKCRRLHMLIKMWAHAHNTSIKGLWRDYCTYTTGKGLKPCSYTMFFRVTTGEKKSKRVQQWIARRFKTSYGELWNDQG